MQEAAAADGSTGTQFGVTLQSLQSGKADGTTASGSTEQQDGLKQSHDSQEARDCFFKTAITLAAVVSHEQKLLTCSVDFL